LGYVRVAGVDEAGRGPLAGPVTAACVILPRSLDHALFQDSKKLAPAERERLFALLLASDACIGEGMAGEAEIDGLNILQASLLAMRRAVLAMPAPGPDFLLIDGKFTTALQRPQQALVKGDAQSASIAAASIIAKVRRDSLMAEAHRQFPAYGFDRHKGYPTKAHRLALREHGSCPLHRCTFKGVRELLGPEQRDAARERIAAVRAAHGLLF
jgi:ribonuclease HII